MQTAILFPVFVQIFLTFLIGLMTLFVRARALRAREVRFAEIALDSSRWPATVRKFGNSYSNQFELPVIFYVLCIVALMTGMADDIALALAWGFVLSRIVHACIHVTSNHVPRRGMAFIVSAVFAGLLALHLFSRLLTTGL